MGAVTIGAEGYEGSSAEVIGLSGTGGAALTGNVLVNLFKADTEASLVGGTTYAASLSVTANATDGYFGAVGTAALGGDSGDGESVMVATFSDMTTATVGDTALATPTTLNLAGPLTVGATSAIDVTSYTVGVSAGGDAGAAAQLTLNELSDTTQAVLADTIATIASTAKNGDVSVTSADNVAITPTTGGLAGGGDAGLGASANVVVLNSANSALMADDSVSTPGDVSVLANETRDINLLTATAALGGEVGIAATVGVILVGPGSSSADLGDLNANGSGTLAAGTAATRVDLVAAVGAATDGNSASIIGGSVTAASVAINATGKLATGNIVGSLGVGLGAAGVGASVGYTEVDQTINASAIGGTITTNSLTIGAAAGDDGSGHAVDSVVFAGGGGLYVGIAGALAFSIDSDDVTAELSSTVNAGTGTVTSTTDPTVTAPVTLAADSVSVTASDSSTVWANAYGAAIGLAAAGVSVATADRDSTVTAEIATLSTSTITTTKVTGGVTTTTTGAPTRTADDSADPVAGVTTTSTPATGTTTKTSTTTTTVSTVGNVAAESVLVQATDAGDTYAYALAGAGGGDAGAGGDASATDNATVLASVVGASTIIAPGSGLTVQATDTPDAKAFTFGVSVGAGAAVGASVSEADVTSNVTANVDGAVDLGITNGLSILAATDIDGSPASSFPSSSTVPGSTSQFEQGGTTAAAWSIAGSGSLFVAANGTVAIAENDATVTATGGGSTANLALPSGNISVEAANNSDQFAQGDGVAVSGGLAVGAVIVTAESSPNTTASLYATTPLYETSPGTYVSLVTGVIVSATGDDTNNALAMAGSGGLFAGDGANAATSDTSNVAATIGANSFIQAASIQIAASHTDTFGEMADSLNAGLVGASAALSSHEVLSNVGVAIGDGATLYATAAGLSPCLNGGCAPAIDVTATNNYQDVSSGTQAGAGGGINGAGATSTITFDNSSQGATITIGAGAILSSGFDPVNDPGSIAIIASTTVFISDTDSLTTGGLIEGAGVNSEVGGQSGAAGQIDNSITIGAGAAIATYGILDIGTYTTGSVTANAYVTTYGVAGVGEAIANINLTSNQTITVLASTTANEPTIINGFGDVNITAGDYIDGGYATSLFGDTSAEAYVRGLIAVPVASASTTIGSNATVDIANTAATGPQTLIASGANVTINADEGSPLLASDGTGHGYELGFIPVTNGSNNTSAPTSSVVTIGAAVVAGEYHTQNVTINSDLTITVAPGGAPVSYAATPNFDILTFLNDDFTGPGAFGNLVSTTAVPTVSLGALYASGGVIRIKADTLMGSGTLTAYGAPTITVTDNYPIYLILAGGAYIPDTPGGSVVFNGAAGLAAAQTAGMTVSPNVVDSSGTITVTLTYGGSVGSSSAGPGLFNTAPLTNVGGLIALYNDYGSIGSAGTVENANGTKVQANANITADQAITYEPNGAYVFQADDASGDYIAGGSAYSEWASAIVYPGGAPSTSIFSAPNADTAMEYVATSIYLRGSYNGQSAEDAGGGSYYYVSGTIATDGSAATEAYYYIDDALYGHAGNTYPHSNALVLFGGCIQGVGSSSCLSSGGYDIADVDGHYGNSQQPNYVYEGTLSYSYSATGNANAADNENTSGSAASQQIYGSYVAITAATIDVNGSITVGKSTSYSADVSAQLGVVLGDFSQMYKELYSGNVSAYITDWLALPSEVVAAGYSSAQAQYLLTQPFGSVDITPFLSLNPASASLSVPVTYNGATNQISFGNISTFSSGANVKLDGDIVSTNTLGNIHVNAGYGSVSITNESQIGLDLADINTGSAAGAAAGTSTVMITNRLIDQVNNSDYQDTATYIYNPATGLKEYLSDNGASPVDSNGNLVGDAAQVNLPSGSTSSSTTYQTVVGAEFQFVQEATLSRTVTEYAFDSGNPVSASDWTFSSGTAQDPWYYVNPSYISSLNASGPASSSAQSTTPVGWVIISSNVQNGVNQDPAFQETITGNTVGTSGVLEDVNYSDGSLGFATQPGGDVQYSYYYPTQAFLRLTTTVKADNPFGISFGGNATGSVNITSFGSLILGGNITNSTGGAQIFSLTGSVTQTATATTTSNSLNVIGNLGIGSSGTPLDVTLSKGLGTAVGSLYVNGENGNVYVDLNSGANGFVAQAQGGNGTVVVNAAGTLAPGAYGFAVTAANVTLTSTTGSIGSASSPLALISGYNYITDSYNNVTANISAYGDVALTIPYGNLLVGQIASTSGAGNITINVPNGGIYSAVSQTPASSLTSAQVANIVSALNLEAGSDAAAGAVSITSFQNTVDADLASFATFLANGSVGTGEITLDATTYALYSPLANAAATQAARTAQNGSSQFTSLTDAQIQAEANTLASTNGLFVLNTAALATFAPQAAAALGIPVASITNAQIQAWANAQYQNYAATFTQAYGANWQATVIPTQAQASAAFTGYQSLLAAGSVTNGVFTLNSGSLQPYASAAATAAGVTVKNVTNAQIQTYANNLYQADATIFAANVNTALGAYPGLAANGTVSNGVFTLNMSAMGTYQAAAAAADNVAVATSAQVQTYANSLYQGYATVLSQAYGANWQAVVAPTAAQSAALTGYQALIANGAVTNGVFTLNTGALSSYANAAAASDGVTVANVTTTQIQTYANSLYQGYATSLSQAYGAYWQATVAPTTAQSTALTGYQALIANGAVANGVLSLNAGALSSYANAAAASDGVTVANVTNAQIQAYANSLYQAYTTTLTEAYGSTFETAAGLAAIDAAGQAKTYAYDFTVASGSALATSLTQGANWTAQQLVDAIDVSAFQPSSGNVGSSATPNIVGHDVNITVSAGSVGTLTAPIAFSLALLASDSLTPQEQAAIAVATTPGSVQLTGTLANGQPLPAGTDLDNLPQGATVTGLSLPQTAPIFVSATGAFTILSTGAVYLQGTTGTGSTGSSSVTLNSVSAQGDVYVAAPGSILASTEPGAASTNITATGDINLNAGTGSIGSSTTALTIQTGGVLTNASGGGDVYLSFASGDAEIERVSAGGAAGTASITTASGYSILSDLTGINVEAPNIILDSGGTIGTSTTPFDILASAALTATATDAAYISAPTVGGNAPNNLTVASLVTGGDLSLVVGGALTVAAGTTAQPWTINTTGNVSITSASLVMQTGGAIQATGAIGIDTSGDATLGLVASTLSPATASNTVTILAGGSILSNGDPLNVQTAAYGAIDLTATSGIGTAAAPLTISGPYLSANVTGTDASISLAATSALEATQVQATGAVSLSGTSLVLDSVVSGGTQTLSATGAVQVTNLTANAGDIDVTQANSFSGETIFAEDSISILSSGDNQGDTLTAQTGAITLSAQNNLKWTSPSSLALINWATNIGAATTLIATSGGALTLGTALTGGAQTIHGSGAVNVTTTAAVAGTIGIMSDASTVTIGSVTKGDAETITAKGAVSFTALTTTAGASGDIDVTSQTASITGGTVSADGSAKLVSGTSNTGDSVTATAGDAEVDAGTFLSWSSVTTPKGAAILSAASGDLTIETVTAGKTASLTATTGGILPMDASATLSADSLTLIAGQDIGSAPGALGEAATPFAFTLGSGGVLSGSAGGSAWLTSSSAVTVTTFSAATGLSLTSSGALRIETVTTPSTVDGLISSSNGAVTLRAASVSMDQGAGVTAGGAILISSAGGVTIGQVTSTSADTTAGDSVIDIEAVGSILGNGGTALIEDTEAGVAATLNAGETIGPISVEIANLSATAAKGDLNLTALSALHATSLTAANGSVDIQGAPNLTLDSVTAGTRLTVSSTSGFVTIGSASGESETIEANGAVEFTTLTTTTGEGGDIDVTSDTSSIAGVSLTADGSASLTSATSNAGVGATVQAPIGSVTATNGSVTLTAGSLSTATPPVASATASIDWATINAGTFVTATSGGSLTLGSSTSGTMGAGGVQTIHATGAIGVTTLSATAGTIGVTSDASTVKIGAATSNGTQTIEAYGALGYTTLKTTSGDIDLTSTGGSITGVAPGDTLDAQGSFDLQAATTLAGTSLTAETGSGSATAGGAIDLATTTVATTLGVTTTGGTATLGSATSGGTQTITGNGAVAFTTLTTIAGRGGDIEVTSQTASIQGGSLAADGSASLTSASSNDGATATATNGSVTLAAASLTSSSASASIDWTNVNAGTFVTATSGGSLTLGSATSGGAQALTGADGVTYTTLLAAGGDIGVAGATIAGGAATTQAGKVTLTSSGSGAQSIDVASVSAATTFGATATAGGVAIGSATSDGTQTVVAAGPVAYTTLKTTSGDIDLTSTAGSITGVAGDTLDANGWFTLKAATTISGTSLTADNGGGSATGGGAVALNTINTATTLGVTSTGDSVTLGSATSGGAQALTGADGVTYTTLLATGGDIGVAGATIAGGAATTQAGKVTLTSSGSGAQSIDVASVSAATTFGATATAGGVAIGSATIGRDADGGRGRSGRLHDAEDDVGGHRPDLDGRIDRGRGGGYARRDRLVHAQGCDDHFGHVTDG